MNIKISQYLLTLIKTNIIYIATDVLLIILTGFIISLIATKNIKNKDKVSSLSAEVMSLKAKTTLINSVLANNQDLDADLKLLNRLIPDNEDYFSIIYALDQLSQETGFMITSYVVNLDKSNAEKLRLSISGIGDSSAFMKFLQEYNFEGGRLITSDNIELTPQVAGEIKIDVTFYTKKVAVGKINQPYLNPKLLSDLAVLRNKVQFSLKTGSDEAEIEDSYPRKSNPF